MSGNDDSDRVCAEYLVNVKKLLDEIRDHFERDLPALSRKELIDPLTSGLFKLSDEARTGAALPALLVPAFLDAAVTSMCEMQRGFERVLDLFENAAAACTGPLAARVLATPNLAATLSEFLRLSTDRWADGRFVYNRRLGDGASKAASVIHNLVMAVREEEEQEDGAWGDA